MRLRGRNGQPLLFRIDENCVCEDRVLYRRHYDDEEEYTLLNWVCGGDLSGIEEGTSPRKPRNTIWVEAGRYFGCMFTSYPTQSLAAQESSPSSE